MRWPHRLVAVLVLGLVTACGGQPASVDWRNVVLPVPDGWIVVEVTDERVRLASAGVDEGVPADGVTVLTVAFDPSTLPDDVRSSIRSRGATLESDAAILVGDEVPATRFVVLDTGASPPTRELIVLVPSRGIVAVGSVVPGSAVTDPAARLLDDLDAALGVLVDAAYGPPVVG